MYISNIQEIIKELYYKRMVILIDKNSRENEGDIVILSKFITHKIINFIITYAKGLVCLVLTNKHCNKLKLPMMKTSKNTLKYKTNFTVSIESAYKVTTGISAFDRAKTILIASFKNAIPSDIIYPGHIFPLKSKIGGIFIRPGHTEASCDLSKISGSINPSSVICEIINKNGKMARYKDLLFFSKKYSIKLGMIDDLIKYRKRFFIKT